MILLKYVYNIWNITQNEGSAKIMVKIVMMQQCWTEWGSAVDLRCHLTNFKMLVSQSGSAVLRQTVELLLNIKSSPQNVLRNMSTVCWGAVKVSNFLDFWLSQGSVATYCRWGGSLCDVYKENFLANHLVKEFWKSVHICQSYYQHQTAYFFRNTVYFWHSTEHQLFEIKKPVTIPHHSYPHKHKMRCKCGTVQ